MDSQGRNELYKKLWDSAEKLRGSIDRWYFKEYFLGFFFYKYISEDFNEYVNEEIKKEDPTFDYSQCEDNEEWIEEMKSEYIREKGYFIYPSQLFKRLYERSQQNSSELNTEVSKIFFDIGASTKIYDSEEDFEGLFESVDLNDTTLGKEVGQRNAKIKDILSEMSKIEINIKEKENGIFGDAFEHLIREYASKAGKSGGEYFTPPEVSELLMKLSSEGRNEKIRKVYDPACGSGSLLLKFFKNGQYSNEIEFCGQEINNTSYNLCRMNMLLHGVNYDKFTIKEGDTLMNNKFDIDERFDMIVSNPPYSIKWEGKDNVTLRNDERFAKAGVLAPKNKADFAFIQHSLHHLSNSGTAAIVCFPGILFREKAEKDIRKWMVSQRYVDAVIQLPDKLFYGTSISTCIMVLKKAKVDTSVLFIDASSIFTKVPTRNELSSENIDQIIQLYRDRKDVENYSKVVDIREIEEKDYTLSVDSYVVKKSTQEKIDIVALNKEIAERTEKISELRKKIDILIQQLENGKRESDDENDENSERQKV